MFERTMTERKQAQKGTVQKKDSKALSKSPNLTGIPDSMKTRFENLSGFSFDDVRVHYNSGKPAQLQAYAYAQGNQVYVAPGQEPHLGHELGHVVQQKQGRVHPTKQVCGIGINDASSLEHEADTFGVRENSESSAVSGMPLACSVNYHPVAQLANWIELDDETLIDTETGEIKKKAVSPATATILPGSGHDVADIKAGSKNSLGIGSIYFETVAKPSVPGQPPTAPAQSTAIPIPPTTTPTPPTATTAAPTQPPDTSQDRFRLVHKSGPHASKKHTNVTWDTASGHIKEYDKDHPSTGKPFHTSRGMPFWSEKYPRAPQDAKESDKGIDKEVKPEGLAAMEKVASYSTKSFEDERKSAETDTTATQLSAEIDQLKQIKPRDTERIKQKKKDLGEYLDGKAREKTAMKNNALMTKAIRHQISSGNLPERFAQELPLAAISESPDALHKEAKFTDDAYQKTLEKAQKHSDSLIAEIKATTAEAVIPDKNIKEKAAEIAKSIHNLVNTKTTKETKFLETDTAGDIIKKLGIIKGEVMSALENPELALQIAQLSDEKKAEIEAGKAAEAAKLQREREETDAAERERELFDLQRF